ncbi:MAG TPA: ATP-grasp domain-containing protein [Kribbella sp.]|nr:ATP-grasp domain-containing protein [Kribbella sp.]
MDHSADGVVLLIGSGQQLYRQYLMEGASQRRPLWLIDSQDATWQRRFVVGSSVVKMLDSARAEPDEQALLDAALEVSGSRGVVGVFTYDEQYVMATARIAERLDLRGFSVDGADSCRNKHRTRLALTAADLPQPRFVLAQNVADAGCAAEDFGYPVVLKPRGMGASIGVVRATDAGELLAAFAVAEHAGFSGPHAYETGVLVEELVAGPEISVDGAVVTGEYRPFFVARKELGLEPYFEEVGHVVQGDDPLLHDPDLRQVLAEAHRVLGVRDGITHTEVRLSDRGPVVIEVNARLGGDLIPYLGKLATGIDPGRVAVEVATGSRPGLEPTRRTCVGIRFRYPPEDCKVVDVSVPAAATFAGLLEARAMVPPGATVRLPPRAHIDRYAYVICTADHPAACAARLEEAAALITLEHERVEPALVDNRA